MSSFPHDRASQYLKAKEDFERILAELQEIREALEQATSAEERRELLPMLQELEQAKAHAWLAQERAARRLRTSVKRRAQYKIQSFRFPEQIAEQVTDAVAEKVVGMVLAGEFVDVGGVTRYTDKTARHRALDVKNKASTRHERLGKEGDEVYTRAKATSEPSPHTQVHTAEEVAAMGTLVTHLRPNYRRVIEAIYLEGQELADVIDVEIRESLRDETAARQGDLLTKKEAKAIRRKTRSRFEKYHQRGLRKLAWERMKQLRQRCPTPLRPAIETLLDHPHTDSDKKLGEVLTDKLLRAKLDAWEHERAAYASTAGELASLEAPRAELEEQARLEAEAMLEAAWRWLYASTTITDLEREM